MNAPSLKLRWMTFISIIGGYALSCGQALAEPIDPATHAPTQYITPVFLFLGIIATYTIISLVIGGKKTYFDPYTDQPETEETKVAAEETK